MLIRQLRRTFANEVRFSQGNGIPTAADILYRNPEAIKNRLQLFHLFRLKAQLELDKESLQGLSKTWHHDDVSIVRISYKCPDNQPGIEPQFNPANGAVSVSIPLEKLNLSEEQQTLLLKIIGEHYKVDEGLMKFEVADFPFKEQNEKRAMEIIKDLLDYVKNGIDRFEEVPLNVPKSRKKVSLEFPKEWLKK